MLGDVKIIFRPVKMILQNFLSSNLKLSCYMYLSFHFIIPFYNLRRIVIKYIIINMLRIVSLRLKYSNNLPERINV